MFYFVPCKLLHEQICFEFQTIGLSFAEYAVIKSAFQNTFLDSLFIHAQKEVLNSSSYLNLLLRHPSESLAFRKHLSLELMLINHNIKKINMYLRKL